MNMSEEIQQQGGGEYEDDEPIVLRSRAKRQSERETISSKECQSSSSSSISSPISRGHDKLYLIPDATCLLTKVHLLIQYLKMNPKSIYFHFPVSTINKLDLYKSRQDQIGCNSREASRFIEYLISNNYYACISDKVLPWKLCEIFYNNNNNQQDMTTIPKEYRDIIASILYRIHRRNLVRESQIRSSSSEPTTPQKYHLVNSHLKEFNGSLVPVKHGAYKRNSPIHNWTLLTEDSVLANVACQFGIPTTNLEDIIKV